MQFQQNMSKGKEFFALALALIFFSTIVIAQVNTVEFGKNRVQYKKFKWKYYQTDNFNAYFYKMAKPSPNMSHGSQRRNCLK